MIVVGLLVVLLFAAAVCLPAPAEDEPAVPLFLALRRLDDRRPLRARRWS